LCICPTFKYIEKKSPLFHDNSTTWFGILDQCDPAKYATRIARNERAQLFCIHVVTPQRFKFFHRHTSSPSPSSDYTKQESREEQRLISSELLPVYDSESNEFVGEVEIPVELQLMSQELNNRMALITISSNFSASDAISAMRNKNIRRLAVQQMKGEKITGIVTLMSVVGKHRTRRSPVT
jgi:CBS domain-containing protein